jgi:hypothetical protein
VLTKTGIACDYCGRFISYADLDEGRAVHHLLTPDSHFTREVFESYHIECKEKSDRIITHEQAMRECPVCGGSGFSGRGTGYDDVCSECGGQRMLPRPAATCMYCGRGKDSDCYGYLV